MTIVVSDSFNRANGALGTADTGQTWWCEYATGLPDGGPPNVAVGRVISNKAGQLNTPGTVYSHDYVEAGVTDYIIEADLTSPTNGGDGILFRLLDGGAGRSSDLYYYWTGNFIWKHTPGSGFGQIRTVKNGGVNYTWPATPSSVHVKISCVGDRVDLWADGVLLTTDSPGGSGGSFTLAPGAEGGDGVGITFEDGTGAGLYRVDNFTVDDGLSARGLVVGSMSLG